MFYDSTLLAIVQMRPAFNSANKPPYFASGLVLYWFVNNLLAILQQYLINRTSKPVPEKVR